MSTPDRTAWVKLLFLFRLFGQTMFGQTMFGKHISPRVEVEPWKIDHRSQIALLSIDWHFDPPKMPPRRAFGIWNKNRCENQGVKRKAQRLQTRAQNSNRIELARSKREIQLSTKTQMIIENVSILAPIWATILEPFSQKWPEGSRAMPQGAQKTPTWTPRVPKWSPRVPQWSPEVPQSATKTPN